jgi:hypothetical protein
MSATVQTVIVLLIVLAAGVYAGRRLWRTLRPAKTAGCDAGCGCGADDAAPTDWAKTGSR